MMFVYLSSSGHRIVLPAANRIVPPTERSDEISFLDEQGRIVATFCRADLVMYTMKDYGSVLGGQANSSDAQVRHVSNDNHAT
jgi:hypothetical protein